MDRAPFKTPSLLKKTKQIGQELNKLAKQREKDKESERK